MIALTVRRLGPLELALATFALAWVVFFLAFQNDNISNSTIGYQFLPPTFDFFGIHTFDFSSSSQLLCLLLAVFGLFALLIHNLKHSATGRAMYASRSSAVAAQASGSLDGTGPGGAVRGVGGDRRVRWGALRRHHDLDDARHRAAAGRSHLARGGGDVRCATTRRGACSPDWRSQVAPRSGTSSRTSASCRTRCRPSRRRRTSSRCCSASARSGWPRTRTVCLSAAGLKRQEKRRAKERKARVEPASVVEPSATEASPQELEPSANGSRPVPSVEVTGDRSAPSVTRTRRLCAPARGSRRRLRRRRGPARSDHRCAPG